MKNNKQIGFEEGYIIAKTLWYNKTNNKGVAICNYYEDNKFSYKVEITFNCKETDNLYRELLLCLYNYQDYEAYQLTDY